MDIIKNINSILNSFSSNFKSEGYKLLNSISNIDMEIFQKNPLKLLYSEKNIQNYILIINVLITSVVIYYAFKYILSLYSNVTISNMYKNLLKVIMVMIVCINSLDICKYIVKINSKISKVEDTFLKELYNDDLNYNYLEENIDTLEDFFKSSNKTGINGMKDIVVCSYVMAIIVFLSARYVIVVICILVSPLAFFGLIIDKNIFRKWLKLFLYNLLLQNINKIIIFIPLSSKSEKGIFPAILIGSLVIMYNVDKKVIK